MSFQRVTRRSTTGGGGESSATKIGRGGGMEERTNIVQPTVRSTNRPLVALLEGKDCSEEMPILKGIAAVAFCDAKTNSEIHERVWKEAWGVFLWDKIQLTAEELEKFSSLKVVVKIGPGLDNVDLEAAADMGIAVCHVNGYGIEEAADTTLGVILNLYRKINWFDKMVKTGNDFRNVESIEAAGGSCGRIRGQTLGIIGMGSVGVAVALRAKAFGFNVIFFDPYLTDGIEKSYGLTRVHTMVDLLVQSDCVTLHCGLRGIEGSVINDYTIHLMRSGSFLVNVSNSSLVDNGAVIRALSEKRIMGAASSSVEHKVTKTLKDVSNLIFIPQPHSAFLSVASRAEFKQAAAVEMRSAIIDGVPGTLRYLANKEYFVKSLNDPSTGSNLVGANYSASLYAATDD